MACIADPMDMAVTHSTPTGGRRNRSETAVYDDGYLRVEHDNFYLACGGRAINLPRTEFLIVSRLARTPGRIVTAEELWKYVWGTEKPVNAESLHVYIYRLRHKFAASRLHIETMVNVGYRLNIEGQESP